MLTPAASIRERRRLTSYVRDAAKKLSPRPSEMRALHGGREFLVHLLELLGRIGADTVTGLRGVGPKL